MIGILFLIIGSGTMLEQGCLANAQNCGMLQQPTYPQSGIFNSMLSSASYPILKDRRCDQGRCMAYLFKDECDICDSKECMKQCTKKRRNEEDLIEFIKNYAESSKNNAKFDFINGDPNGYLKNIKTVTVVDKSYTGSSEDPKIVTVTMNEVKTVTVDSTASVSNEKDCKKKNKKTKEESSSSCEENKEASKKRKSGDDRKRKDRCEECRSDDKKRKDECEECIEDKCEECLDNSTEINTKHKRKKDKKKNPPFILPSLYTQSSNLLSESLSKDVTVTRILEKIKTVEKPITLFRELTTTITKEKPIINYKVTTFTDVSTKMESVTVTATKTVAINSLPQNDIDEYSSTQRTVLPPASDTSRSATNDNPLDGRILTVIKTVQATSSIEPSKASISIITVTATPETREAPAQSTTCLDIPTVLSTITIGSSIQTVSKSFSVSRAVAKGCEVTTDMQRAKHKTVCRFINVPKNFIRRKIDPSGQMGTNMAREGMPETGADKNLGLEQNAGLQRNRKGKRRTVIRTFYKTEEPQEENESVVTTTVYVR
ncbi:uncharacterized protein VICG_00829 [Vittaforma corneae ATCC 50505]|uniref:Uncharacterized protein n=1 Tax=Vittaforma corneae (strain ATCC 50505) TaxID=993615 RepID=L2GMY7_VITCO|nr:uncharacterized protein VICG_00829 [Vittaforma corneae ATCC 50505]ELA42186.1 hypothetical protein VICG_00829 [Vittaforma corneae ATCC 50505]